jgi:hypothetical protein
MELFRVFRETPPRPAFAGVDAALGGQQADRLFGEASGEK